MGARSSSHRYDANNRLDLLTINGALIGVAYDARGNVTGRGSQGYYFDQGNRLQLANGIASYTYDGHGRRIVVNASSGNYRTQVYSQGGQLLHGIEQQGASSWTTNYVYLGNKLIAETRAGVTTYQHTDALGSPVARTNTSAQLISRTRYEPYGATAAGTNPDGIGFTGHVNDVNTGLVYMQQRYYDPVAGRFLSVDPVVTDAKTGAGFGRYHYANNSPYKYTDPDGRFAFLAVKPLAIVAVGVVGAIAQAGVTALSGGSAKDVALAGAGGFLSGATTAAGVLSGATLVGKGAFVAIEGASTTGGIVAGAAAQAIGPGIAAGVNAIDVAQTIKSDSAPAKKDAATKDGATKDPRPKENTSQ